MQNENYKSGYIQKLFNISNETVRTWCTTFQDYLSPGTNPPGKQHRAFNDDDLRVFIIVDRNDTYDDSFLALQNNEQYKITEEQIARLKSQPRANNTKDLAVEVQELSAQLQLASMELERLRDIEIEKTRMETRLELIEENNKAKDKKIGELQREIGRLEAQLDMLRNG